MKEVTIDCRGCVSRSHLHKVLADALSFPDHYGSNLDALHDCLTDIGQNTEISLLNWNVAEEALGSYALGARRAMEDAASENPHLSVLFL